MVLVLLIIFMVVTPLLEKDILVRVPETEQVEMQKRCRRISWSCARRRGRAQDQHRDGRVRTSTSSGSSAILAPRAERKLVFFVADDKTNYGKLVAALDGAKQAGAETLGMMTQLPEDLVKSP